MHTRHTAMDRMIQLYLNPRYNHYFADLLGHLRHNCAPLPHKEHFRPSAAMQSTLTALSKGPFDSDETGSESDRRSCAIVRSMILSPSLTDAIDGINDERLDTRICLMQDTSKKRVRHAWERHKSIMAFVCRAVRTSEWYVTAHTNSRRLCF